MFTGLLRSERSSLHCVFYWPLLRLYRLLDSLLLHTQLFAQELHTSGDMAYYILATCNGASFFGRVLPSLIADRLGAIETLLIRHNIRCRAVLRLGRRQLHCRLHSLVRTWVFLRGPDIEHISSHVVPALAPRLGIVGTWMGITLQIRRSSDWKHDHRRYCRSTGNRLRAI